MDVIELGTPEANVALASAPFETHSRMTQIAMAERPSGFIADEVMPRVPSPFKFQYTKVDSEDQFTIPDTIASRAGRLNEVEFGATLQDGSTEPHGLLTYVPWRDIQEARQQQSAWDPGSGSQQRPRPADGATAREAVLQISSPPRAAMPPGTSQRSSGTRSGRTRPTPTR